ncbi:hypothetical protein GCM10018953_04040 [Streptosporangium nondiastaticum]|uniref:hypothetical protein n=1 Tax=Streptosporangium nondiastaticum TaxID=35764 RepID=UPI0031F81416
MKRHTKKDKIRGRRTNMRQKKESRSIQPIQEKGSNETINEEKSGGDPAINTTDFLPHLDEAFKKVPEIGDGSRWYDLPYSILSNLLQGKCRRFIPAKTRVTLNSAINYLIQFNEHERHAAWSRDDLLHNLKVPSSEHVTVPAIWVVELFPPSHIENLAKAIDKNSWDKERVRYGISEANQEVLERSRAGKGSIWWELGEIISENSHSLSGRAKRQALPAEFDNIKVYGLQVGEGLTAVLAQFALSSSASQHLDSVWHIDHEPKLIWSAGRLKAEDRHWSGLRRTQEARRSLHQKARSWLYQEAPGVFATNAEQQPLVDLLLLDEFDPSPGRQIERNFSSAIRALGLTRFEVEHISCANAPGLLLEKVDTVLCPTFKDDNTWTLWGKRESIANGIGDTSIYSQNKDSAITYILGQSLRDFFALLAISNLLQLFEGKYAELRDESRTRHKHFKGRHLKRLRSDFLTLSLDVSSLVRDIDAFNARTWRYANDIRFNLSNPPWVIEKLERAGKKSAESIDLIDMLQARHIKQARELAVVDKDYREVLSTVASLGASIDTIKVSRVAIWVSLASLLVALVTLLVADIKTSAPLFSLMKWIVSLF